MQRELLQLLRNAVPLLLGIALAHGEIGLGHRQEREALLQHAPLFAHARHVAADRLIFLRVEPFREALSRHRDHVEERERFFLARLELGERPHAVRRVQDGAEAIDERVRLLEQLAALLHTVDDRERRGPVFGLAGPLHGEWRQLVGLLHALERVAREPVVVDRGIVGRGEEAVDLFAHGVKLRARRLVEAQRLFELARAEHEVGSKKRAVGHVRAVRVGDRENLERSKRSLGVAEPHVHPGELVEHRVELGRLTPDLRVRLASLRILLHLIEESR